MALSKPFLPEMGSTPLHSSDPTCYGSLWRELTHFRTVCSPAELRFGLHAPLCEYLSEPGLFEDRCGYGVHAFEKDRNPDPFQERYRSELHRACYERTVSGIARGRRQSEKGGGNKKPGFAPGFACGLGGIISSANLSSSDNNHSQWSNALRSPSS